MNYNIALLRGDGIGPEIVDSAVKVLLAVGEKCGHTFSFTKYLIGGAAIDATGAPLPEETVKGCLESDSVLLGAVGGPKWDNLPGNLRPEKALLGIRSAMGLFTNLRPAKLYPALKNECPLRADIVENGFDSLHDGLVAFSEEKGYKKGQVLWIFRIAITGSQVTPGGATEMAELFGKEECIRRMKECLARL